MTSAREKLATIAALGVGSGLVLVAAQQPQVTVSGAGGASGAPTGGGASAATALALAALAGAGVLLLLRGWARPVIGVLLLGAAAGVVVAGLDRPGTWTAYTVGASPAVSRSGWAWLVVAGGVVLGLAALAVVLRGRGWPEPGRRYEAGPSGSGAPAAAAPSGRDTWDALDRGEDPTA